jgi:hypothetical protein
VIVDQHSEQREAKPMTDGKKPETSAIEEFARMHGFESLSLEHIARMAELAPRIAQLGSGIPRPQQKSAAPAERGRLQRPAS